MIFVKQSKQIYKTSSNGDVKSVATKYRKTASDLLKTYRKITYNYSATRHCKKTQTFWTQN